MTSDLESIKHMQIDDQAIHWAYRLFFDREPENFKAVQCRKDMFPDTRSLREHFMNSHEFTMNNGKLFSSEFVGHKPKLPIDIDVSAETYMALFKRVEQTWERFGKEDPHWSVLSAEQFRKEKIDASLAEFYESGELDAELIDHTLSRNGLTIKNVDSCIEIGCGLGRITKWLSGKFKYIYAYDISDNHLRLAREHQKENNIPNVDFRKLSSFQQLKEFPTTDFLFSIIVLQHNPPPIIAYLIKELLSKLNPSGFALFQVPTYLDNYSFNVKDYLNSSPAADTLEMHVIPQKVIFELAEEANCRVIEVIEDSYIGKPKGGISNTFLIQKR